MRLPLIPMREVWHVGTLDPELRGSQHPVSYEGAGLSVSNCPAAWRSMASLDGPTLRLGRPGALWLDLGAMTPEAREAAVAHAVEAGLAEETPVWRAWYWEGGTDEWLSRPFRSESSAVEWTVRTSDSEAWPRPGTIEGHLAALPANAPPPPCPGLVEAVVLPLLTEAGDATEILAAFWAEDVLRPAEPDIVGTWWRSRFEPRSDVAPRGAVLPCAVGEFAATRVRSAPRLSPEPETVWHEVPLAAPTAPGMR